MGEILDTEMIVCKISKGTLHILYNCLGYYTIETNGICSPIDIADVIENYCYIGVL